MVVRLVGTSSAGLAVLALGALICAIGVFGHAPRAAAQDLDIEKVFWCDAGKTGDQDHDTCVAARNTILTSCTSCHAITPIVKAQKEPDQWRAFLQTHRTRVPDIPDPDYEQVRAFLTAHYNPKNPVPKLPPELDKLGVPPA